jgi:hypothetical protein
LVLLISRMNKEACLWAYLSSMGLAAQQNSEVLTFHECNSWWTLVCLRIVLVFWILGLCFFFFLQLLLFTHISSVHSQKVKCQIVTVHNNVHNNYARPFTKVNICKMLYSYHITKLAGFITFHTCILPMLMHEIFTTHPVMEVDKW